MQTWVMAKGRVALLKTLGRKFKIQAIKKMQKWWVLGLPDDHRFWYAQNNSFLPQSSGHQDWRGRPIQ